MLDRIKQSITGPLVRYLVRSNRKYVPFSVSSPELLEAVLQPADIILVEGNQRFSTAVKYLTQSTWSHAALYVGHAKGLPGLEDGTPALVEADLKNGVIAVPLSKYENIIDLARFLVPTPPVPTRWRRGMLALGSGDPTRAICSTRIAEAFQSIAYPILPHIEREVLHIRHHSLFTPRDFDVSPYFKVIKPTIEKGFDFRQLDWNEELESEIPHRSRLVG